MIEIAWEIVRQTWYVIASMSVWLLLGFLVAGLLSAFISQAWLERHLGGRGLGPVFRASLFGVPLPLCSCGVIPVAASLRSRGASRAATTAFLISTPQTGVDSILVTYTMLGPLFAVFRPVAALVTGFLGGAAVQILAPDRGDDGAAARAGGEAPAYTGLGARLRAAWEYGAVTLPGDIGRALLVGVLIAGVVGAVVPADFFAQYLGPGPLSILLMMAVGIPVYVCATASVPLAASFIFLGISPGAALAFLIAGPATNAATLTTVGRVLGRRTLVIFIVTIAASAFGGGLLLDWLLPRAADAVPVLGALPGHTHHMNGLGHLGGLALVGVMGHAWWRLRRQARRCGCEGEAACSASPATPPRTFAVVGMHCSHCVRSVTEAIESLAGVSSCRVSLDAGQAVVEGERIDDAAVVAAVTKLGFKVETPPV